jgi:hypothetical protein
MALLASAAPAGLQHACFIASLSECGRFPVALGIKAQTPKAPKPGQWREVSMICSLSARV